jgi:hypothetical protein
VAPNHSAATRQTQSNESNLRPPFTSRQSELAAVRRQVETYARLRTLVDRWIDLATELSELKLAENRE